MKMILSILCTVGLALPLVGQDKKTELNAHQKAAEELLIASNVQKSSQQMAEIVFNSMLANLGDDPDPELMNKIRKACEEWVEKVLSWEEIKHDYVKLYTDSFTEEELKELTVFYSSGVGRKSIQLIPHLMQKGAKIGEKRAIEFQADLTEKIQEIYLNHVSERAEKKE